MLEIESDEEKVQTKTEPDVLKVKDVEVQAFSDSSEVESLKLADEKIYDEIVTKAQETQKTDDPSPFVKVRPNTAALDNRPPFRSYYGMGTKNENIGSKRTFNVKAPTNVYQSAKMQECEKVVKSKKSTTKRTPLRKQPQTETAPFNRWLTAYQLQYKAPGKVAKPKIITY